MVDALERNRQRGLSRRLLLRRFSSVMFVLGLGMTGCILPSATPEVSAPKPRIGRESDPLSVGDRAKAESLKAVLIGSGIPTTDILDIKPIIIGPNQRLRTIDDEAEALWGQASVRSSPDKLYNPRGRPD